MEEKNEQLNGQANAASPNNDKQETRQSPQPNFQRATAPLKRPLRMRETVRIRNGAPVFAPGGNAKGSEQILQVVNDALTAPLTVRPAADQGPVQPVPTEPEASGEAPISTGDFQALDIPLIEPALVEPAVAQASVAQPAAWPKSRKKRAAELDYRNFEGTAPGAARDEQEQGHQNNGLNHQQERGERVEPTAVRPFPFPPTKPSQRVRTQQATAKLDYYKKLAELQQLNLDGGRSVRAPREHPLTTPFQALPKPELRPSAPPAPPEIAPAPSRTTERRSLKPQTKVEALPVTPQAAPPEPRERQREARNLTPQPVPTPKAESRVEPRIEKAEPRPVAPPPRPEQAPPPRATARTTGRLDLNRYVEAQRRLPEAEDNGLTIEDRLAARLIETPRPRLPQRVAAAPPELPLRSNGHKPEQLSDLLSKPQAKPPVEPRPENGSLDRYQRATVVNRPTAENGLSEQRFKSERPREVLLDPTRIDPHLISLSDFNPRAAKYFDQVAVSLISISYKRLCKRVLIASAQHGEGRSCVTLNLAGALARARQRVLVVDCDLVKPSVLRLLGIDSPLGLSEAVSRGLAPNAVTVRVQPAAFNLMPTREPISQSAELLASPRFHEMLQAAEPDYDFILFDSPPLLESRDANLLVGLTDGTMLVIRPGLTTTAQMAKAVSLFNEKDICGVVLNRVAD